MHPRDVKVARIANMSHTRDEAQMTNRAVQQQINTENKRMRPNVNCGLDSTGK